jgi:TetR/AcrR family transcriptional regulator
MAETEAIGARAEKTRRAVLEAAEQLFAERGFAATRLEDIAERVGIRRASIVYYFRDKRELYEAVLESVFGDLHDALAEALDRPAALLDKIEAAVSTWVDYVGRRPTIARLSLRKFANATRQRSRGVLRQTGRFEARIRREILDLPERKQAGLNIIDPVHMASMVAGPTVFFVAAMPMLVPDPGFDPLSPAQLVTHKQEVLDTVRRLLGAEPSG